MLLIGKRILKKCCVVNLINIIGKIVEHQCSSRIQLGKEKSDAKIKMQAKSSVLSNLK